MSLAAALGFPLGGGLYAPFIVNLLPIPDDPGFNLTEPVRMTVRDPETYVDAGLLHISAGYALTKAQGDVVFDDDIGLPGTFFSTVLPGFVDTAEADLQLVSEGVQITKTVAGPQKSVTFTPVEAGVGFEDAMVTAVLRPDIVTIGEDGAVLGMENGPRNTAVYFFFESQAGLPYIRVAGPADGTGTRVPDRSFAYDWSDIQRYVLIWNEVMEVVELYAVKDNDTSLLTTEPIANFQEFADLSDGGSPSQIQGGRNSLTAVYGIEGASGDRVTVGNVAVTNNVAYPIIGIARPGQFVTIRRTDESVRYHEGDPRTQLVSPWFGPPNSLLPNADPSGGVVETSEGAKISKVTPGTTYALHREEPGLIASGTDGFILDAEFSAISTLTFGDRVTGMGFLIWDGQSVFLLSLFTGVSNTIGLLKSGGDVTTMTDFFLPPGEVGWGAGPLRIRFTVDPRRGVIDLYTSDDFKNPIMTTAFDRGELAELADIGLSEYSPSIGFGHVSELDTAGSFDINNLVYSHIYQAWEARDGIKPDSADPPWLVATTGFQELSPLSGLALLGGGYGPTPLGYYIQSGTGPAGVSSIEGDQVQIVCDPGETLTYFRSAAFDDQRGGIIETSLQITEHKPRARSGVFLLLDDGLNSYMLSFVDTDIGKFAAVPVRAGLSSFVEKAGLSGEAKDLSFPVDWDQPHTYRMERRPLDGLYIFVDDDEEPALVIPDSARVDFPATQFSAPTVAFGVLSSEGSTSLWDYTRTMWGSGYEISFRRSIDTEAMEEEIRNSQAIIVASADDV